MYHRNGVTILSKCLVESSHVAAIDDGARADDDRSSVPGCSYWDDECSEPSVYGDESTYQSTDNMNTTVPPPPAQELTAPAPPPPTTAAADTRPPPPSTTSGTLSETPGESPAPTLDPDLLLILGEDPTSTKEYGEDVQRDLAIRLTHIATNGLSKEARKELKDKYLVPSNCKLIKAPSLNPEIRASLVDTQSKRDKGIENKQLLTACALSSLSAAITKLLSSDNKNQEILKLLMDTARILGDIQHSDSVLRRFFILSTVKKELKEQLEKTKIDESLFGTNLAETLKSAKTINKSAADIRASTNRANANSKFKTAPGRSLNSRAPPVTNRRPLPPGGAGRGQRAPPPYKAAPTSRATITGTAPPRDSRTSWRPPPPRYRQ